MPSLILRRPQGDRIACRLDTRRRWTVGSHSTCALRMPLPGISGFHCEILLAGGRWMVRHLHGGGDTRVNGKAAVEKPLADRDVISVGSARLEFVVDPHPEAISAPSRRRSPAARPTRRRARPRGSLGGAGIALAAAAALSVLGIAFLMRGDHGPGGLPTGRSSGESMHVAAAEEREEADPPAEVALWQSRLEPVEPVVEHAFQDAAGDVVQGDRIELRESPEPAAVIALSGPASASGLEPPSSGFVGESGASTPSAVEAAAGTEPVAEPLADAETGAEPAKRGRERSKAEPAMSEPAIEAAKRAVLLELTALDPARAKSILDDTRRRGAPADAVADLEAEVEGMERARSALAAGIAKAVRERTIIKLRAASSLLSVSPEGSSRIQLEPSRAVRLSAGDVASVELADAQGGKIGRFRLTSLPDELLLRLISADDAAGAETRRDLATLLRHGEGPARVGAAAGGGDPPAGSGRTPAPSQVSSWLERKARTISRSRAALARGGDGSPDGALLAGEAVSAWVVAKAAQAEGKTLDRLRDDLVAIREATMPLAALFRASVVEETTDGRLRLVYKLSGQKAALQQAPDLRPVGSATKAPRFANGGLVLEGEYRLGAGNPFAERMSVRGRARPLAPEAPNINLTLWTHEADAVSPVAGKEQNWFMMLRKDPGTPSDFFVFGIGYRVVTWNLLEKKLEQVALASTGDTVPLPALVVLAGSRGATLHQDRGECLFAAPAPAGNARPVEFRVDWSPGEVSWTVGTRRIVLGEAAQKARFASREKRTGSVGILTNGRPVALEELEVLAPLDPAWARERRRERANRELEQAAALPKP